MESPLATGVPAPEGRCAAGHGARWLFRFQSHGVVRDTCLGHALVHRPLLRTAVVTALVVGTVLTAINQGNVLLEGRFPAPLWWKIPLTYSVPYCVSTFSALRISRLRG